MLADLDYQKLVSINVESTDYKTLLQIRQRKTELKNKISKRIHSNVLH